MALETKQLPLPQGGKQSCLHGQCVQLSLYGQLSPGEDWVGVSVSLSDRPHSSKLLKGCGCAQPHHPPGKVFSQMT